MCRRGLLAVFLVGAGCVGSIVQKEPTPVGVELAVSECKDISATAGTRELQRLTSRELDRTVSAVLGDTTHAYRARLAVSDELISQRRRYFRAQSGTSVWAEASILAAEEVSLGAAAKAQFTDCTGDQRACARTFIERTGRRLWRRTLSTGEVDAVLTSYDAARVEGTHVDGIQTAVMTLLASPDFFFFQAAPLDEKPTGTVLAERLASMLWQQAPDDTLLDAAESGALDTPEGFDAQVERMLADPRADETFAEFLSHWLAPEKVATIDDALAQASRNTALYPDFKPPGSGADGLAYSQALTAFLQSEARVTSGTFEGLMLSKKMGVNDAVSRNLGLSAASTLELRDVDNERRAGVLGQPAVLTAFGRFEASDPVHRGVFLLRYALCNDVPPPDANVNTALPPADDFPTTRARFVSATTNTQCAGCHSLINPLGFAWENFDAVGRFRSEERSTAVDATATIPASTATPVDGLADLSRVLASDPKVRSCLTRQFSAWALRRPVDDAQFCSVRPHADGFYEPSGPLSSLVKAVLASDSFRAPATPTEVTP
ncbi:MAG: DUF1588 domain-containing protein [Archangium sp.]